MLDRSLKADGVESGELVPSRYALRIGDIDVLVVSDGVLPLPNEYHNKLRLFDKEHEVAPGVIVRRTGGHTPGHSVVRLTSGNDRLTFAGDAVFAVGFEHPDWYNGFEHYPEEAARVRIGLLRELAATMRATWPS